MAPLACENIVIKIMTAKHGTYISCFLACVHTCVSKVTPKDMKTTTPIFSLRIFTGEGGGMTLIPHQLANK